VPKAMTPPPPYVYAWFDNHLSEPYNVLWKDYRSYPGTSKVWDLYVYWEDTGSASITLQWDPNRLSQSEYSTVTLHDLDGGSYTDMLLQSSYTYVASVSVVRHFQISCSVAPPEYHYKVSLNTEWNLVSFPVNTSVSPNDITVNYLGVNYTWQQAVDNTIILGFIYGWNAPGQYYDPADALSLGQGYWMYAYHPCVLKREVI
jgi:hypothetical protein